MNTSRGFTLIEVLVAMTLIAFMSFVLYSTIRSTRAAQTLSEERAVQTQTSAAALDLFVQDMNMAYLSLGEDTTVEFKRTLFRASPIGGGAEIVFSTMSHRPTKRNAHESDSCLVTYRLERDPEYPGLMALVRRETRRLEAIDPELMPAETRRLVGRVELFDLWFFDDTRDEWIDTWDTTSIDGQSARLPQLVRVHLAVDVGGYLAHFHSMARPHILEPLNLLPATGKVTSFSNQGGQSGQSGQGGQSGQRGQTGGTGGQPSGRTPRPIEMPRVQ
jgi:prepilin-type N-terminal cleavage/methylation domain-containing protein